MSVFRVFLQSVRIFLTWEKTLSQSALLCGRESTAFKVFSEVGESFLSHGTSHLSDGGPHMVHLDGIPLFIKKFDSIVFQELILLNIALGFARTGKTRQAVAYLKVAVPG